MAFKYVKDKNEETRYRRVIELIEKHCQPHDKIIIDLGSGKNPISKYISHKEVITLDFDASMKSIIICDLSSNFPLRENCCDIVIAAEILEHIYYSKQFLKEIKRILKPGGYLIITTPNCCSLLYRILWLFGRVPPYAAKADYTYYPSGLPGGHVHDYNFSDLKKIFSELDLKIITTTTNGIGYGRIFIPHYLIYKNFGQKCIILANNRK
jgi:ubiquinone/menaquinone biosynthesis C-methylase UbiE